MRNNTRKTIISGLFLALALLLPYIFHIIGVSGKIFLPMHIPVLLCGFILGPKYGLIIGIITPILNSLLTGMPPIYPTAISMSLELATYGLVSGFLYKNKKMSSIISLIIAMLLGRGVSGIASYVLISLIGGKYTLNIFMMGAFVTAIWGIIIQLMFIPLIVKILERGIKEDIPYTK